MLVKIESTSNAIFKHIKKLHSRSGRNKFSQYIAEGKRAVFDAIKNGAEIEYVVFCENEPDDLPPYDGRAYVMNENLFELLKLTVNSQGVIAVVNYTMNGSGNADFSEFSNILYLDAVSDPGNMGTILRSADALGADAVILGRGCVDIFNPKVVRSSMASLMKIPVFEEEDYKRTFSVLRENGFQIIATLPRAQLLCCDADFSEKTVLVMGNEANGICDEIIPECTDSMKIPMMSGSESLNVATAATVMLYEIMRSKYKLYSKRSDTVE